MGFWGAVEETAVTGAAGAVGLMPYVGEVGAAAIHGADAAAHAVAGETGAAAREVTEAGASAIPSAGHVMAALDIAQAPVNAVSAVANAASYLGGHGDNAMPTTGEMFNDVIGEVGHSAWEGIKGIF